MSLLPAASTATTADVLATSDLVARYRVNVLSSMLNNAGVIPSNGDSIKLVSDVSGNSAVNCLVLNGVAGNYASVPDAAALRIVGNIDLRAKAALNNWANGGFQMLVAKDDGTAQRSYTLYSDPTGKIGFSYSSDGSTVRNAISSVVSGLANFALIWVRVTYDTAGTANFYTSTDGVAWTQLGTSVAITAGAVFAGTATLGIGANNPVGGTNMAAGAIYRAQIYSGIAGTLVFDDDFSLTGKLTTSHVATTGQTVTINTSGDTGARICGARDLYQGTAANQPILTIAAGGNKLTYPGVSQCNKTGAFSLSQPVTVYIAYSQETWIAGRDIYDGGSNNTMVLQQTNAGTSPQLFIYAGANGPQVTTFTLATRGIMAALFNGTASSLRHNRSASVTGNAGTAAPNGFTLGALSGASLWSNITVSEVAIYNTAHSDAAQLTNIQALKLLNNLTF